MKQPISLAGASSRARVVSPAARILVVIGIALIATGFFAAVASAGPLSQSELAIEQDFGRGLMNAAPALLGFGVLVVLVGGVLHLIKQEKYAVPAFAVGGLMVAVAIGGFFIGFLGGITIDQGPGDEPPPGYVAKWQCNFVTLAAGGPGGAHDASAEFPDSPFVAADGGSPDLNKAIGTPIYDVPSKSVVIDISIDDDAAIPSTAFLDEDTYAFDVQCFLTNPIPAVGGGLQEIPLWGRASPSRVAGTINNGSYAPVFYCDVSAGTYLGFGKLADSGADPTGHDADHSYVSYDDAKPCPAAPALVGDWIQLGTSDGDVDGEYFAVFFVLDFGFSDFTAPALGSTDVFIKIEMGTDPNSSGYKGNVEILRIDLNALVRT